MIHAAQVDTEYEVLSTVPLSFVWCLCGFQGPAREYIGAAYRDMVEHWCEVLDRLTTPPPAG